jgi:hypothetical protein
VPDKAAPRLVKLTRVGAGWLLGFSQRTTGVPLDELELDEELLDVLLEEDEELEDDELEVELELEEELLDELLLVGPAPPPQAAKESTMEPLNNLNKLC